MKKKILIISIIVLSAISSLKAVEIETLTGDTKLACEALLCLSSPTRPSECAPSLARYFGISLKHFSDTVKARKDFLSLCPAGNESKEMVSQVNSLSQITGYCTTQELNANIEKVQSGSHQVCSGGSAGDGISCRQIIDYSYRISPKMTKNCQILTSMSYNDYKFKYTCSGKFYTQEEWSQSKEILNEISKDEYKKLPENLRISITKWETAGYGLSREVTRYYKAKPIKKDCWVENR